MFKGLSLDQAPPFEAPLLFFIGGILFAIVGSLSLLFGLIDFGTLHLFTLGFLASVMVGALQQMLPVVVGVRFDRPKFLSLMVAIPFYLGVLGFFLSLSLGKNFYLPASILLLLSLGGFGIVTLLKLFKAPRLSPTVLAMRLSVASLLVAVLLGTHMLMALYSARGFSDAFALSHALFALFGWIGLLIVGVSFQVIPMFYVTNELDEKRRSLFTWGVFAVLLLCASSVWIARSVGVALFEALLLIFALFALVTVRQLRARKRAIMEPSIGFWYVGLGWLALLPLFSWLDGEKFIALYLIGFATSIICAMLYKIIPFLSWFHISSWGFFDMPTMREMIDERLAFTHLFLHASASVMLLFSFKGTAALLLAGFTMLLLNLLRPMRIYFAYKAKPSPFGMKSS